MMMNQLTCPNTSLIQMMMMMTRTTRKTRKMTSQDQVLPALQVLLVDLGQGRGQDQDLGDVIGAVGQGQGQVQVLAGAVTSTADGHDPPTPATPAKTIAQGIGRGLVLLTADTSSI